MEARNPLAVWTRRRPYSSLALLFALLTSVSSFGAPSFISTGNMNASRYGQTATLLPTGKVLITGGSNGGGYLNTADVYDPATGTFTATSQNMTAARAYHTATSLPNGKVLIAGGQTTGGAPLNTAELYDPISGTFTSVTTDTMSAARSNHTATLLPSGKVLIAGGGEPALTTAELYDFATGTFTDTTTTMTAARYGHTAALLPSGKVLIAGGQTTGFFAFLITADLYDPSVGANGTFTRVSVDMTGARGYHTATLLPNGKVLIAGGVNGLFSSTNTAMLYDPAAGTNGTFTATTTTMTAPRGGHTATLLPNGKVLITGGFNGTYLDTSEVYDPAAGTNGMFTAAANMTARSGHTATLLPSAKILIAGGYNGGYLNTAEFYDDPAAGTFTDTAKMIEPRSSNTATLLANGKVLLTGGRDKNAYEGPNLSSAELFDPAGGTDGTFTAIPVPMTATRMFDTATLLPNGKVLIAGGQITYNEYTNTAELYDPAGGTNGTFTAIVENMTVVRGAHTATLLPNGKVLIVGGRDWAGAHRNTAELYDPAGGTNGTFTAIVANMATARAFHTATLLPNGKVFIAGGENSSGYPYTAELYDPTSGTNGTFTAIAGTMTAGSRYTATLLPNAKVLLAGGWSSSSGYLDTADLYDPASGPNGAFAGIPVPMTVRRSSHSATLLPNGKVLLAGGYNISVFLNTSELYDPTDGMNGKFTAITETMNPHQSQGTLLPNGKVLFAGYPFTSTPELYDVGLGYSDARRPVVSTVTSRLCQPANLALSGSLFTGDSEASSGSTGSSPANAPLLRLHRMDNDRVLFASPQVFSATAFFSSMLENLPSGRYRAAIVSNAIPSRETIIDVGTTPLLGTYSAASVNVGTTTSLPPSSLPPGYNGALYPLAATVSSGFTGTVSIKASTGEVILNNAGPPGTYTITISSFTSCGSPVTTFTLDVLGPPSSVIATGARRKARRSTPRSHHSFRLRSGIASDIH